MTDSPSSRSPRASAAEVSSCSSVVGSSVWWLDGLAVAHVGDAVARAAADAELLGRALGEDPAALDDRDAVGELLRLVEVVRGQQHGLAEVLERADRLPRGATRGRVEAGRRLVEEDQLGVADQREREVEAAALAAGERGARASSRLSSSPTSSITSSTSRGCG